MKATINGVELSYRCAAHTDRPWVTLVPGITNDASFWDDQVVALEPWFSILRFDPRGHGASEPGPADSYSVPRLLGDIVGLWDRLGIERSHLVGLGFGGSLSIGLALASPARVRSLTACCCRATITTEFIRLWNERADQVGEHGVDSIVDNTVARWFTDSFAAFHPQRVAAVRAMVRGTSAAGYIGHARAFATIDWSRELATLQVPTLFVSASHDPGGGRADVMQEMSDVVTGSAHVIIPDAGHLCNIENPAAFNAAVLQFLRQVPQ